MENVDANNPDAVTAVSTAKLNAAMENEPTVAMTDPGDPFATIDPNDPVVESLRKRMLLHKAAPDLLAACKQALETQQMHHSMKRIMIAAIAKAEGKTA